MAKKKKKKRVPELDKVVYSEYYYSPDIYSLTPVIKRMTS